MHLTDTEYVTDLPLADDVAASAIPPLPPSDLPPVEYAQGAVTRPDAMDADARQTSSPTGDSEGGEGGKAVPEAAPSETPLAPETPQQRTAQPRRARRGDDVFRPAPEGNPVLSALHGAGLYRSSGGDGRHNVTCPWVAEHAADEPGEATYYEPTIAAPWGDFECNCTHVAPRTIGGFLDQLGVDRMAARCKPRIRILEGEPHRILVAAEKVLLSRGDLFRTPAGIVLVRINADSGDVETEPLTEQALLVALTSAADFEKFDGRSEAWRRCDPPQRIVNALHKSQSQGILPELKGLARQPFFRRDGSGLVTEPGFDQASGVFAAFDPAEFPLPEPTRENALDALFRLRSLLAEFEFEKEEDRSATVCAMLTAAIRDYLPVAPGFNITASSPGSGKSYLASVIAPFAGLGQPRNISYPTTGEEASKVVLSIAMEKRAVVLFDDMNGDWLPHGALNRMLTSGSISERMLGTNRVVSAPVSSLVIGTGNNIRPLRDMARRVASIYLLPKTEAAAMREFIGRPDEEVRRNRGRYVSDALTIVRAFDAGGRRVANVPNIAGFEEWSETCRHSLIWLGLPDPASSLIEQIAHDPDAELLGELLQAWADAFGEKATFVRQVLTHIERHDSGDLHDAVMELPCVERGHVNQSKFGRYLGRNKNRIVGGFQLVEAEHSERRAWAVKRHGKALDKPAPSIFQADPIPERAWTDPNSITLS